MYAPTLEGCGERQERVRAGITVTTHAREIERLTGKTKERGLTLIPLKIYFKNGRAKVELGLARGKKLYDKRETLRRKVAEREVERSIKSRN